MVALCAGVSFLDGFDILAISYVAPVIAKEWGLPQQAFGPMWEYAHDLGLKVYFRTDMLALTTPLEKYLVDRFGSLDTENPEFWHQLTAGSQG